MSDTDTLRDALADMISLATDAIEITADDQRRIAEARAVLGTTTPRDMAPATTPGPTIAVTVVDGVDVSELEPDGAGPTWRVACMDLVRDGDVLASLQITPWDILVFPAACRNIGIVRVGDHRTAVTDKAVGVYAT